MNESETLRRRREAVIKAVHHAFDQFEDGSSFKREAEAARRLAKYDPRPLLAKYDVDSINRSPIRYCDAVQSVADELLAFLDEYESARSVTICDFTQLALKLNAKYVDSPHLTLDENKLLSDCQQYLAQRLDFGLSTVRARLFALKQYADNISARIDRINLGSDFIDKLSALEREHRPSFAFLVEDAVRIINDAQRRVNFFIDHRELITKVVGWWATWNDNYRTFGAQLSSARSKDGTDSDIYREWTWFNDWRTKRLTIERRFFPLIEFALKGNLMSDNAAESVLSILQTYRDDVDKFYLHERKNIYQKFAFTSGGEIQEKFKTESELYKLTAKLQRSLQEVISGLERTEERTFLLRWAEPLRDVSTGS